MEIKLFIDANMKKTIDYEKNTCGCCLYWKADDMIGITGRCYHPDGQVYENMLLFDDEERCDDKYKENTYVSKL